MVYILIHSFSKHLATSQSGHINLDTLINLGVYLELEDLDLSENNFSILYMCWQHFGDFSKVMKQHYLMYFISQIASDGQKRYEDGTEGSYITLTQILSLSAYILVWHICFTE